MKRVTTVEDYIRELPEWRAEIEQLREILLSSGLTEAIKWGAPCYAHQGRNVVGIASFKSWFGLWFHQGALLADDAGVLINAQEGKTRALRQWRMTSAKDIKATVVRRYVNESVANINAGREIRARTSSSIEIPKQLSSALRRTKGATAAFRELRPGLKREYAEFIASAKREDTKTRRIEKILPMILAGCGLNDRYRSR